MGGGNNGARSAKQARVSWYSKLKPALKSSRTFPQTSHTNDPLAPPEGRISHCTRAAGIVAPWRSISSESPNS